MAEKIKFSQFPEVKEIQDESIIPIVQNGENMKIAFQNFAVGFAKQADVSKLSKDIQDISKNLNTMTDTVTGTVCVLTVENGLLTIREA